MMRSRSPAKGRRQAAIPTAVAMTLTADGACVPNPGCGGWAAILATFPPGRPPCIGPILTGRDPYTTNNRMELMGVIVGLESLPAGRVVTVRSDSTYVIQGASEWLANWKRQGFLNIKNADLWRRLDRVMALHTLSWVWVRGHAGDPHNELADRLATQQASLPW